MKGSGAADKGLRTSGGSRGYIDVVLPLHFLHLLLVSALAVPADHTVLTEADDCVVSIGPFPSVGPRTLRAECAWPEALLAPVKTLLTDFTAYGRIIPNIHASTVLRVEERGSLVHQQHDIPLFADREVLLWMREFPRPDGGFSVTWHKADEPFEPGKGRSVVPFNTGLWDIAPRPGGGLHVVHEVAYDPGVRVPDWVVRRYRTSGITSVLRELRARAGGA